MHNSSDWTPEHFSLIRRPRKHLVETTNAESIGKMVQKRGDLVTLSLIGPALERHVRYVFSPFLPLDTVLYSAEINQGVFDSQKDQLDTICSHRLRLKDVRLYHDDFFEVAKAVAKNHRRVGNIYLDFDGTKAVRTLLSDDSWVRGLCDSIDLLHKVGRKVFWSFTSSVRQDKKQHNKKHKDVSRMWGRRGWHIKNMNERSYYDTTPMYNTLWCFTGR